MIYFQKKSAGNCDVVEHAINIKDSGPIRQAPRQIPLRMRNEVDNIIEDMKRQEVIEES